MTIGSILHLISLTPCYASRPQPVQSAPASTPAAPDKIKQLARLLLGACTSQSQTRRDIADAAGVQDYDMALRILEKLVAVGKLRSEKGRYSRV